MLFTRFPQAATTRRKRAFRTKTLTIAFYAVTAATCAAAPRQPQAQAQAPPKNEPPVRIYLGNDDHTDYMWTADADTYNAVFVEMLDYYLHLADETDKNPSPYQSRFNADGSYWLYQYERQKSPAEFDRLMRRVKDGHISAPLNTLVACYGAQPTEAVLRGMYYAGRLERRYDVRFPLAIAMEDQTLPLGLSSLWAGSGALYSWKGVCGCATQIPHEQLARRDHEMYWYTGHDRQRVLMKWYSLGPGNVGTYTEAGGPWSVVDFLDTNRDFLSRYVDDKTGKPYPVRAAFGFGGDCLDRKTGVPANPGVPKTLGVQAVVGYPHSDHFFDIARGQSNAERQVIVSNTQDFFQDFAKTSGDNLPTESVTYGNEWDLYSASMAETSARVRRAVEKLRAAELMSTLVSLRYPAFLRGWEKPRDRAFADLGLYWEHDWTADGPISRDRRAAWQDLLAGEIENYVNPLHADAAARLGYLIKKPGSENRFYVLNPLGEPRTDFADFPYAGSAAIHVREVGTGNVVPHQLVKRDGVASLRVLARGVPSAGYKTYEIVSGADTSAPTDDAAIVSGEGGGDRTIENAAVSVTVTPSGAIRSLIDKKRGNRELVGAGRTLNDLTPGGTAGTITVENRGPVSVTLRCVSGSSNGGGAGLAHTTTVTLYRDSDRVDIRNQITENFNTVRYWSFGFNLDDPHTHTEELGTILSDRLKSQGGDYADAHARYDHITLNHFADMTDSKGEAGVTLSNADCSFARLGNSTVKTLDTTTPQIAVLAGGQVDGRYLGIQGQNGATFFTQRFALHLHGAYDGAAAMRFALEHQNPLVAAPVLGTPASPYPADAYSLLSVSDPNAVLWAVKPAEEGIDKGVIARVWNLGDAPSSYDIHWMGGGLSAARRVTHIETDIGPLAAADGQVKSSITGSQIQTLRLMPIAPTVPAPAKP